MNVSDPAQRSARKVEWFVLQLPELTRAAAAAPSFEADGWDGISYGDNQCRIGDVVLTLALAAQATDRLQFTQGCTNAVTRHTTVVAATWASLQELSGGRMRLGLGRGDSALADIGLAMQPVAQFEESVSQIRALLAGGEVAFDQNAGTAKVRGVASLNYRKSHVTSRLEWLDPDIHRVPIDLTVAGPRTIGVAARHADRIMLSVGADPERLRWAVELAREEAEKAGRDPDEISYGAYIQIICSSDLEYATQHAKNAVAVHARFQGLHGAGSATGPFSQADRKVVENLPAQYDMTLNGQSGSQVDAITDEFAQRFAVCGPPEECIARLRAVIDTGIDTIVVNPPLRVGTPEERRENLRRISSELIPALRAVPAVP
jgi:5,10-methylenetetrahydromethanopterin reductase